MIRVPCIPSLKLEEWDTEKDGLPVGNDPYYSEGRDSLLARLAYVVIWAICEYLDK